MIKEYGNTETWETGNATVVCAFWREACPSISSNRKDRVTARIFSDNVIVGEITTLEKNKMAAIASVKPGDQITDLDLGDKDAKSRNERLLQKLEETLKALNALNANVIHNVKKVNHVSEKADLLVYYTAPFLFSSFGGGECHLPELHSLGSEMYKLAKELSPQLVHAIAKASAIASNQDAVKNGRVVDNGIALFIYNNA